MIKKINKNIKSSYKKPNWFLSDGKNKVLNHKKRYGIFGRKNEKNSEEKSTKKIFFRGYLAYIFFVIFLIVQIPFLTLLEKLFTDKTRKKLWRKMASYNLFFLFNSLGLKMILEGKRDYLRQKNPTIFIANHLSEIDGLILFYLIGPSASAMVAPLDTFDFPFSFWFKKMEFIDVVRSDIEKINYSNSLNPDQAVLQAAKELNQKNHLIIFPEGHIEPGRKLTYFHTGTSRIALYTGVDIVPVGIVDLDDLLQKNKIVNSGKIKIVVGEKFNLSQYCKKNKLDVKEASLKLRDEIKNLIPEKYYPVNWRIKKQEKIAVIFNIDGTIIDGDLLFEFIKNLSKEKSPLSWIYFKIYIFHFLKKYKFITKEVYLASFEKMFKNYRADDFYLLSKKIFDKHLKFIIYEKIKAIIKDHKESKHKIIIVSSSPAPLVKCFADYLGVDYWLASIMEEKNSLYTGRQLLFCYGSKKKELLGKIEKIINIKLEESMVYGHSGDDEEVMSLGKYKTYINPDKHSLYLQNRKNTSIIEL